MGYGRTLRPLIRGCVLAALGGGSAEVLADTPFQGLETPYSTWAVSTGLDRTDNATLLPGGPSDTIATAGVEGGLFRDSGHLRADLTGSLRFEDYLNGTYKSHLLGQAVALTSYSFLPERFVWMLQDTYGQATANSFQPATPQNRINVNTFQTGPDAYLPLGDGNRLQLGARYSQSDFQRNPVAQIASRSYTGNVGLIHALSPNSLASVNVSSTRVEYRIDAIPSYNDTQFFGHYESKSRRMGVSVDAGVAQIRQSGSTISDPVLRLSLFRRLTASWNINLGAGTQYTNPGNQFQNALSGTRVVNGQIAPGSAGGTASGPVDLNLDQAAKRSDYVSATLDFVRPRTFASLDASLSRERAVFGSSAFDRDVSHLGGGLTRRLRPSINLHFTANYDRRTPKSSALPGDRTTNADLGVDWRMGSMLQATFDVTHEKRSADLNGFGYSDNQVLVQLTYGPPRRTIQFQPPGPGTR